MNKKDLPFKKLDLKSKLSVIIGIGLILFVAVAITAFFIFFGVTGFFRLFGVSYESNTSIVIFILLCFLVGAFFEFIEKILVVMVSLSFDNRALYLSLTFTIHFFMNLITFHIVDRIMSSIFIPAHVLLAASALIAFIEVVFDKKHAKSH
ncbi:YrvL family regulatory protein [Bacillus sonorensis]|uniref:Uncharacterized protein n=2 Tax=Bacillus sonorensis TaxID=119858 RepID=M5P866_9BACI|nr:MULTISPECIES: YrvL family regulatory protein [Bacillus]TWK84221.1 hypothetical protein CHCC20335_4289 [Bacillus paralicheniformis]ASB89148.1 uncharacterized protein S101395_02641 [Bacillus sonorensis]EME75624.1 hypothetical protein BSONL12_04898 [Bacillus sonorensis L12]MBG9915105.1 hypothetical protein [Bacillus sonorensis]MCF7618488.1 regulatory YrvL family protein [Bacillus sonorensis]